MGSCPPGHSPEGVPGIQHRRGALAATSLPFPRSTRALPAPEPASRASRGTRAGPRARLSRPGRPEPARGKFLQLRRGLAAGAPGLGLVRLLASAATAAPLSDDRVPAPSRPEPQLPRAPRPPRPRASLCARRPYAPALGTKGRAARRPNAAAVPGGARGARPGRGARWAGRAAARSPAVEPVLAGIALDHKAGNVVGQPADAVHGHRRHVAAPPLAPPLRCPGRAGPGRGPRGEGGGGGGRGRRGRSGRGRGRSAGPARALAAGRVHTMPARAAGAAPGAARRAAGRRAESARGARPRAGHKANGRAGAAGGEPRPHRRDPRPPSGRYVSAPGGAASARRPGPRSRRREGGPR